MPSSFRRLAWLALAVIAVVVALVATSRAADAERRVVLVAPVDGTIDMATAPFVSRVLDEAERVDAAAVVLEIDTFGGRLDAAVAIRDRVLASGVPTVAFVHPRAISAGALISLAAETIAVSDGATLGAATPVQMEPGGQTTATDEKTVSYVRKEFAATAAQRGRPVELAEAMVDADVDVPGVVEEGKLLTLTGDEALALGVAERRADDLPALLADLGLRDAEVRAFAPNWAERVVRVVTSPVVSSLLMTLGMLGLLIELRTPGFGAPGLVGVLCLALFFAGHLIVELAGLEEILLVAAGVGLLALEVFVVPGFGLAGILGILAIVAGLGMSLLGAGATAAAVLASVARAAVSFVVALVAMLALLAVLPRSRIARGVILEARLASSQPAQAAPPSWVGASGTALTPLRPAGVARLAGERVDVVSDGPYVPAGAPVEAIRQDGNRVVVRQVLASEVT